MALNQGRIHRFMEKTRKKRDKDKKSEDAGYTVTREQESLRKKVLKLMKKQKPHQVQKLVRGEDDSKPWGQGAQAKVCVLVTFSDDILIYLSSSFRKSFFKVGSCLIELLLDTAYIQSPVSQSPDGPPDFRPAFRHSLRTIITKEQQ